MTFKLRPYQDDLISSARARISAGDKRVLMVAPTGAGKTALASFMLGTAAGRGMPSWFNVHRRELIIQSSKMMDKVGIPHGVISSGFPFSRSQRVQVVGVNSVKSRMGKVITPKMIIWDECHHVASKTWTDIFEAFPDAIHIGLTATPMRLDGKGLGPWFDSIVEGPTTRWLIQNGYLTPYKLFAPWSPDMAGVKKTRGDFSASDAAEVMDKPSITGDCISHYRRLADGKRAIVFASNIEHSKHVVEQFRASGYRAAHLDGTLSRSVRDAVLRQFERGEIQVLSNVDLFGEGFDLPAIEAVILLRPTASTGLYMQQVGRALRTFDGKDYAIILDHAGNAMRHGLPDEIREWSLEDRPKRAKKKPGEDEVKIRQCPNCFAVHEPAPHCPECGHVYEIKTRKLEVREGELSEVDQTLFRAQKKREQTQARTMEQLVDLATDRGYKNPTAWATHVFNSRQTRR
jgi:superfamily II DNA or RNA helicase